ncbi:MAG: fused MFS/spermidine synthase [Candidatus Dormibacterales bacterium]
MAGRLLLPLVFVSGAASLGVEFSASRLLAPYFGTSLYVWGILIGFVLIYLSAGYVIGGRLADRRPDPRLLYQLTAWAGLWVGVVPLLSYPVLLASQRGFAAVSVGLVAGTLLAVVLLFAVPVTLLGCVSPFAIRLLLLDLETGGRTAGRVYALSTAGSIVGTFLPVFWSIPSFGTRATLIGFSALLIAVSLAGMWPRRRGYWVFAAAVVAAWALLPHGIRPASAGRLLYETESAYNYIQVVQVGSRRELILDEGQAIHSEYDPSSPLTGGYWDYLLLAPYFRHAPPTAPSQVAFIGLAAGTSATQYREAFGARVGLVGVEIDPAIVAAGRRYFDLGAAHAQVAVADGRYWLVTRGGHYSAIVVDAYQQPYIPFHLATREFFEAARRHLAPGGVVAVNVGRTPTDYRLVAAIASTMRPVFPSIFLLDVPGWNNTIVFACTDRVGLGEVESNLAAAQGPLVGQVAAEALAEGRLRASPYRGQVFTDDLAPIDRLVDEMILEYAAGPHAGG